MLQILHNPRCGKSRTCLAFLNDTHQEYEIIHYLQSPLSSEDLILLIKKLAIKPLALIRQKEAIWIEQFKGKELSDAQIIQAIVDFPILMERPILLKGNHAIIARDLEKVKKFL